MRLGSAEAGPRHAGSVTLDVVVDGGAVLPRTVTSERPRCSSSHVVRPAWIGRSRPAGAFPRRAPRRGGPRERIRRRHQPHPWGRPPGACPGAGTAVHRRPARPARGHGLPRPDRLPRGRHHLPPARLLGPHRPGRAVRARRHRLRHASGSTASATSSCSRSSSGCSTPASRCRTSAPPSSHLRERGVDDLAQITLMSDGASVYECTSADEVIDLVQGGQGVFGIAVGRVWREVEGALAQLPSERADDDRRGVPPRRRAGRARRKTAPRPADSRRSGRRHAGRSGVSVGPLSTPRGRAPLSHGWAGRRRGNLPGTSQAPDHADEALWSGNGDRGGGPRHAGPAGRPAGAPVDHRQPPARHRRPPSASSTACRSPAATSGRPRPTRRGCSRSSSARARRTTLDAWPTGWSRRRSGCDGPLRLEPGRSEHEVIAELRALAARNTVLTSMIGLGYYGTLTPAVIRRNVLENPAWYTAYTPYQPEISQGRLEALLNFQTVVSDLTGLAAPSASLLDEATAAAEAMTLVRRTSKVAARRGARRRRRRPPADPRRGPDPGRAARPRVVVADLSGGRRPTRPGCWPRRPAARRSSASWCSTPARHGRGARPGPAGRGGARAGGAGHGRRRPARADPAPAAGRDGRRHRGRDDPAVRGADGLRRPARRLHRRCAAASERSLPGRLVGVSRGRRRRRRRTGSRCRPASSTSAGRRRPATSAPRRCCSR